MPSETIMNQKNKSSFAEKAVIAFLRRFGRVTPNFAPLNYLLTAPLFRFAQGRWPQQDVRRADGPAMINDFVFAKSIANRWSVLELAAVDKEFAKHVVKGWDQDILTANTVAIIKLDGLSKADFIAQMRPYLGKRMVAKPTHGSGTIVFLSHADAATQLERLYRAGRFNYFYANRESQYAHLEKKIMIEKDLSDEAGSVPDDLKFHCSYGRIIYCQYDTGRFSEHRRAIIEVPSFNEMSEEVTFPKPTSPLIKPSLWTEMVHFASQVSRDFEYVRVDVYEIRGKIYFGELTFTPGAGMGDVYRNASFERKVLAAVLRTGEISI